MPGAQDSVLERAEQSDQGISGHQSARATERSSWPARAQKVPQGAGAGAHVLQYACGRAVAQLPAT